VKKYCRAEQATDDNMAHAYCWITKATNTHSQYVVLHFQRNNGCTNATQCYNKCTACPFCYSVGLYTLALAGKQPTLQPASLLKLSMLHPLGTQATSGNEPGFACNKPYVKS
jgi:hypothetical protein